ncbi:hypothetical protein [Thioclava sp. F34-6]|uniref:hypothetical protein n=1 Tax=Thioclava sp. F34-6 TaxID=1973003 RepID=UPI001F0B1CE7|nr:hypothetical protein [Thioclava sp. F34-6]
MNDELLEVFCEEYTRHMNALRMAETGNRARDEAKLTKIVRDLDRLVDAIIDGVPAERVKDRMETLEIQKTEIEARLTSAPQEEKPLLHPSMGVRYRKALSELRESLEQNANGDAIEVLRSLIDRIVMHPAEDVPKGFVIDIEGDLVGILSLSQTS